MAIVPNFILAAKLLSGADSIRQGDLLDYTLSRSLLLYQVLILLLLYGDSTDTDHSR